MKSNSKQKREKKFSVHSIMQTLHTEKGCVSLSIPGFPPPQKKKAASEVTSIVNMNQ